MQKASFIVLEKEKKRLSKTQKGIYKIQKLLQQSVPFLPPNKKKPIFPDFFLYRMISSKIFVPIFRIFSAAMQTNYTIYYIYTYIEYSIVGLHSHKQNASYRNKKFAWHPVLGGILVLRPTEPANSSCSSKILLPKSIRKCLKNKKIFDAAGKSHNCLQCN